MKKLYILAVFILCGIALRAQSLTATNTYIDGDASYMLTGHTTITNISNSPKDVVVLRTVNNFYPGHNSYFCWVQCYGAATSLSPDHITLAAGADTDVFRGDVETFGISGISVVAYSFYDVNNPADSVSIQYVFDATTGIGEVASGKNYISKPYPNPAVNNTTFYVGLAKGSKNAHIQLFNMLGAEVKDVPVTENKGTMKVNLSDLKSGVYFYSLVVEGKTTTTGKLMVSRD